jgi:hypothetical protein
VFQCYLDDSGTSALPVLTMAGFVANLSTWEEVEPATEEIMTRYGVPVFHAKEFHATVECFTNWSRIKKKSFAQEVFLPNKMKLQAVSLSVRKAAFIEKQKTSEHLTNMSPYGFCFAAIMGNLLTNPIVGPQIQKQGISFLIETGNKNNPGIEKHFHATSKAPMFEGCLRALTFVKKGSCRAIQLADYWAFYSRRLSRDSDRFSGKFALPANFYHDIISRNFSSWEKIVRDFSGERVGNIHEMRNLDDLVAVRHGKSKPGQ